MAISAPCAQSLWSSSKSSGFNVIKLDDNRSALQTLELEEKAFGLGAVTLPAMFMAFSKSQDHI